MTVKCDLENRREGPPPFLSWFFCVVPVVALTSFRRLSLTGSEARGWLLLLLLPRSRWTASDSAGVLALLFCQSKLQCAAGGRGL